VVSAQKVVYIDPDGPLLRPHGAHRILLTCSDAFDSLFDGLQSLELSSLWPARCTVHLRMGGNIEYGLRLSIPPLARAMDYQTQRELDAQIIVAVKEEYPKRALGRQMGSITVTKELPWRFYIFSSPKAQDMEDLVGRGPQKVPVCCPGAAALLASQSGGDSFDVTILPFRLYDMPPEAMTLLLRDAENYFSLS